ncbi:MAG: polyphosphate kinase 2 family protein [Blastocatellia bacterium]|nr:polyphosphate kinase 2 family protein [Blastocatellia bacterium]
MQPAKKIKPGKKVKLSHYDPEPDTGLSKEEAAERMKELSQEVGDLQESLYAAGQNSVLIVLQGMDTSGKDGTIRNVMSEVNPQGCRIESFKVPTEQELAHDFLWRVHRVVPPRGMITIFNRSHYEDVLVVRVHELAPEEVWQKRYEQINHFEKLLADNNTIIMKFYLHISRDEQEERLLEREQEAEKAWKLSVGDWEEREYWNDYMRAYEEALSRCSTDYAPWYIIPANKKWYRNLAVAEVIAQSLRPYRKRWEGSLSKLAAEKLAELEAMRNAK